MISLSLNTQIDCILDSGNPKSLVKYRLFQLLTERSIFKEVCTNNLKMEIANIKTEGEIDDDDKKLIGLFSEKAVIEASLELELFSKESEKYLDGVYNS